MDESLAFLSSSSCGGHGGWAVRRRLGQLLQRLHRAHPARRVGRPPGLALPGCGAPVRAADNIPILSYLLLRGRCRACGAPFSARYPLVEALAALLAAALWWKFVAGDPGEAAGGPAGALRLSTSRSRGVLLVLSFIDLATKLLPDVITLPAIPIFFLAASARHGADWLERLIGAAAGYLFLRLIADFYYYVLKREGLGLGDGKLLAVIGAVLGWRALPFVVFVGRVRRGAGQHPDRRLAAPAQPSAEAEPLRRVQIPFGPFLALAALVYLFGRPRARSALARLLGGRCRKATVSEANHARRRAAR